MAPANTKLTFIQKKRQFSKHILEMNASLPQLLEHAFDRYYETQAITYLKIEKRIYRFEHLLLKLKGDLEKTTSIGILRQVAGRVNYVADQLDIVEATVYRRARRRRRRPFNLSDFFEKATNQNSGSDSKSQRGVNSLSEAYSVLGVEEDCPLTELMRAFRRLAKKYHPDTRGGDRSDEDALRRVVEAYTLIKESLAA